MRETINKVGLFSHYILEVNCPRYLRLAVKSNRLLMCGHTCVFYFLELELLLEEKSYV